jgi:arylsulfatase A-like enzyme
MKVARDILTILLAGESAYSGTMTTRRQWLASAIALSAQPARRPNIVFILADDLGYSDIGCYGNAITRTPNLDRLAAEGVRLTDYAVAWPACTPSRSAILTGRYPQRNGLYEMIRNNEVNWKHQFDENSYALTPEMTLGMDTREVTIGQAMRASGYATGVVGKWDGGRARRYLPLQRGFDFFYGFANTGIDYYTHERYGVASMFRGNDRVKEEGHATDLFCREALRFIDANRSRPFFLYLPFNAPHGASTFDKAAPEVPDKYLAMYKGQPRAQYRALITHLDDCVGRILDRLRELGLDDNTLVVFSSDNGGSGANANPPLRAGKATMFEGGLRVPMIARWPGRIPKGRVSADFAAGLDLFPTFLDAAGSAPPPGVKLDGTSLLPAWSGRGGTPRREMFWHRASNDSKAARVDNWKWVQDSGQGGLFDLATDPGEKRDLGAEKPEVLRMVKSRYESWWREMQASEPRGPFRDY